MASAIDKKDGTGETGDKNRGRLVRNRIQCLACMEIIESKSRHDYQTCKCPNASMVDGGLDYVRFGCQDLTKLKVLTEYENTPLRLEDVRIEIVDMKSAEIYRTGFIQLYQEVFAQAPYFETYSDKDVNTIFSEHLLNNTCIVVAVWKERVVGFSCGHPLEQFPEVAKLFTNNKTPLEKIFYISELAASLKYRNLGLGLKLTEAVLNRSKTLGFLATSTITAAEGSNSLGIFQRLGMIVQSFVHHLPEEEVSKSRTRLVCFIDNTKINEMQRLREENTSLFDQNAKLLLKIETVKQIVADIPKPSL